MLLLLFVQILYFLVQFCIDNILTNLIIYYLKPNHIIINDELIVFEELIIYLKIENKEKKC